VAEKKKKGQRPLSGAARLKASGRRRVWVTVTPEQFDKLKLAAWLEMRPITTFVASHSLKAADSVIAARDSVISKAKKGAQG
jgi:uncharacterized protein (DUF1778 family)